MFDVSCQASHLSSLSNLRRNASDLPVGINFLPFRTYWKLEALGRQMKYQIEKYEARPDLHGGFVLLEHLTLKASVLLFISVGLKACV